MQKLPVWFVAVVSAVVLGATAGMSALRRDPAFARQVAAEVNEVRAAHGLPKLRV